MADDALLSSAVAAGDLRKGLEALRDRLAREIDEGVTCKACGGSVSSPTAALAKQLRDTLAQLDGLRTPEASKTDALKKATTRRRTRVQKRADGSQQRGSRGGRASG